MSSLTASSMTTSRFCILFWDEDVLEGDGVVVGVPGVDPEPEDDPCQSGGLASLSTSGGGGVFCVSSWAGTAVWKNVLCAVFVPFAVFVPVPVPVPVVVVVPFGLLGSGGGARSLNFPDERS